MRQIASISAILIMLSLLAFMPIKSFAAQFTQSQIEEMGNFIQAFTQPGTPEFSSQPTPENICDWIMFANAYNSISNPKVVRKSPESDNPNDYQYIDATTIQDTIKKYFGIDVFQFLNNPLVHKIFNERGVRFDGKNFHFGAGDAGEQCKVIVKWASKLPNGNVMAIAHEEWPEEYEKDKNSIDIVAILKPNPIVPNSWALVRIIPTD